MFSRRPEVAVGILALAVAAAVNAVDRNGWAAVLSYVLTGATVRFVTLPGHREDPNRRTGSLLTIPLLVGGLMLLVGDSMDAKCRTAPQGAACGVMLLSSWVVLAVWDSRRNRRLDLEEAAVAAAEAAEAAR